MIVYSFPSCMGVCRPEAYLRDGRYTLFSLSRTPGKPVNHDGNAQSRRGRRRLNISYLATEKETP